MTKPKTAKQYAISELSAERHPQIWIYAVAGDFHLIDNNDHILADRAFKTKDDAMRARSKALEAAAKVVYR